MRRTDEQIDIDICYLYRQHQNNLTPIISKIKEFFNVGHAEIHECGSVYIEDPCIGHYLDYDDISDFLEWYYNL